MPELARLQSMLLNSGSGYLKAQRSLSLIGASGLGLLLAMALLWLLAACSVGGCCRFSNSPHISRGSAVQYHAAKLYQWLG